eukprot:364317-Chlamydomonas_euryale.AAC.3
MRVLHGCLWRPHGRVVSIGHNHVLRIEYAHPCKMLSLTANLLAEERVSALVSSCSLASTNVGCPRCITSVQPKLGQTQLLIQEISPSFGTHARRSSCSGMEKSEDISRRLSAGRLAST